MDGNGDLARAIRISSRGSANGVAIIFENCPGSSSPAGRHSTDTAAVQGRGGVEAPSHARRAAAAIEDLLSMR